MVDGPCRRFKMAVWAVGFLLSVWMVTPTFSAQSCPILPALKPNVTKPGADLTIALLTSLHGGGTGVDAMGRAQPDCDLSTETVLGVQTIRAAVAATDNWPSSIQLPGLSVGLEIYDTCDSLDLAQFSAMRFANHRSNDLYSDAVNATAFPACVNKTLRLGVIGHGMKLGQNLSNILQPFDIPFMDFGSTASSLSDKEEYPNFFRTVPPDVTAIKALVSILEQYGWTYSAIIYTEDDPYGRSGLQTLEQTLGKMPGFCLSEPIGVPVQAANDAIYDDIVNRLIQRKVKAVFIWTDTQHMEQLFAAVHRIGSAASAISWLSGDAALSFNPQLPGSAAAAAGSLLVASPFETSANASFKTWLAQWYPDADFNSASEAGLERLIDAVHAYVQAFAMAHNEKCGGQPGMCDELANIKGSEFMEYIHKVNFTNIAGKQVAFDANGDPVHRSYEVLQYLRSGDGQPDTYSLQKVGEWTLNKGLELREDLVGFNSQNGSLVDATNSTCPGDSCPDPRCLSPDNRTEFVVEAMLDLRGGNCDTLSQNRFTQVVAALYAVRQINRDPGLLPDARLSLAVNDICGDTDSTARVTLQSLQRWQLGTGFAASLGNGSSHLLGMLISGSSGKAIKQSQTLQFADLPLISNSASSPLLSNKDMFPNFLRTVPSDTTQVAAMVDILKSLGVTYIQTINTRGAYGDGAIEALKEPARMAGICIANSLVVDSTTDYAQLLTDLNSNPDARMLILFLADEHARGLFAEMDTRNVAQGHFQVLASDIWGARTDYIPGLEGQALGAVTVVFKTAVIPDFEEYFLSLIPGIVDVSSNPFLNEYWMQTFGCNLPGGSTLHGRNCTGSEMLSQVGSLGMENIMNVIQAYAFALSNLINGTCPGGGVCDALFDVTGQQWLEYLKQVNFVSQYGSKKMVSFDENGDGSPLYGVYQLKERNGDYFYEEVGEWTLNKRLELREDLIGFNGQNGSLVDAANNTCPGDSCPDTRCRSPDNRTEFVVESMFDLRGGNCDTLSQNRFTQVVAALYAVRQINRDPGLLPDARLSLAVNDICGDTDSTARVTLQSLQRWQLGTGFPVSLGNGSSHLLGMLISGSSGKAIKQSQTLQFADLPLISNSASSPLLSNKDMFPNFLRTVPSDTAQVAAMVDILKSLGVTYIQTINTRGAYGDGAIEALKEPARMAGICIANSLVVDSTTNYAQLLTDLNSNPDARMLILFLADEHARGLFAEMDTRNVAQGHFQVLASDTWGARTDYIPGLEGQALGALTVAPETSVVPDFEEYFLSLTPGSVDVSRNHFFNDYWMQTFKCDLPGGRTLHGGNCTGSEMLSQVESLGTENIMNVIQAYAFALSNLINDTCPGGGVCDALFDVTGQQWLEYLKQVDFVSQYGSKKMVSFDENGDGSPLYGVYQLMERNGDYFYEMAATWDAANRLSNLSNDALNPMFTSECRGLCLQCNPPPSTNQTSGDQDKYFRIPGDLDLPIVLQLSDHGDGLTCGAPRPKASVAVESALYALDEINKDPSVLPGVSLGVTVIDSCGSPGVATRRLVGSLGNFVSLESTGPSFALLGPSNPEVTEEVARSVIGPGQLSMISTGGASLDPDKHPHSLSTSASYINEVAVITSILESYDWKYVGVVFSDTPYGMANFEEFQKSARDAGICLSAKQVMSSTTDADEVVRVFSSDDSLHVIVAFVDERDARNLLVADELNRDRRFTWVGTHTWDSVDLVSRLENTAKGMLVVANESPDLPELSSYFADADRLQAASTRNPYLREYLQEVCGPSTMSDCQVEGHLQEALRGMSDEIFALLNALYAASHGANWLYDSKCGRASQGLCPEFLSSTPKEKADAIKRVTLESGAGGQTFSFEGNSVPASYNIKNYRYDGQNGRFLIVGEWKKGKLSLQTSGIELYDPEAEKPQRNSSGCSCGPRASVSADAHRWKWVDHGVWATVILAVSAIFGVLALITGVLFLNKRSSYVVQSASFSLSIWLLFGIILMYLLNIAYMFETNIAICGIRRFGISFVYCVVYAAMFAKSIRANRFARKKPGVDLGFAGSWSQSLMFLAFLLPEIFLVGEWMILRPPDVHQAVDVCALDGASSLECSTSRADLTTSMVYAYFLVLMTFLTSLGALCASSNSHHEGRSVFASSLFSILFLVAWACVYNLYVIDPTYRIPALSVGVTADGTVILVLMFLGKINGLTKMEKTELDTGERQTKTRLNFDETPDDMHVYHNTGVMGAAAAEADASSDIEAGDEITKF